jgi:hypothetical protein
MADNTMVIADSPAIAPRCGAANGTARRQRFSPKEEVKETDFSGSGLAPI